MSKEALQKSIEPICTLIQSLDISIDPIENILNEMFPLSRLNKIRALCEQGIHEGWLCPRGENPLRYGRLQKSIAPNILGVDTVDMDGNENPCAGPGHEHPLGEIDLCFALSGTPDFDGRPEGWTVYPAKSWHIPTVSNGRMVILYFLPKGAIRFGPKEKKQKREL
ncbi:MAG: DUF4863 domain-containing protein [Deltaproteobacteria bacterium]|nr:DUF4863 domain-containing protein [Deltaproteobacteria bacterium]